MLAETYRKGRAALEDFFADTPSGEKRRDEVQKILDDADCRFNAHGVEMNQRYTSSAVLEDGPMLAFVHDHEFVHQPLAHPGAVVPRVWLKQDGRRVSTIDLVGRGRVHPADRDRRGAVARGRSRRRRGTGSADRRPRHRCGTGPRGSHRRTACRAAQHPGHPRKGCTRRAERPRPGRTAHGRSLIMALGLLVMSPTLGL